MWSVVKEVVDNRLKSNINFVNTKNRFKGLNGQQNLICDNIGYTVILFTKPDEGFIRCY